jgi:hypothetical protein
MRGFFTAIKYNMELIHHFKIYRTRLNVPEDLIEKIYRLKEIEPSDVPQKTNVGGWHSKSFTPYKEYYNGRYQFSKSIIDQLVSQQNYKFDKAWFNLNGPGGTNKWHNHGTSPVVSVFYIQTPNPCSDIEFKKNNELFSYTPRAGDFLVFPGELEHRVLENQSTEDRISLAINFSA